MTYQEVDAGIYELRAIMAATGSPLVAEPTRGASLAPASIVP
ncbi:hypothetical protein [Methylobacterium sp. 17Sr1-1]|nr:hypothetical protein [Methylobacterium sp. 17Sr1-1]